jgi:hypothetical protein
LGWWRIQWTAKLMAVRLMKQALERWGKRQVSELETLERYLLARWVRSCTRATVGWLAQQLNIQTRGGMSMGIYLAGKQLHSDSHLQKRWKQLAPLIDIN